MNAERGGRLPCEWLEMMRLKDWIFEENLRPWLEVVSTLVGYGWAEPDWDAVTAGRVKANAEGSRWFEYPLGDRARIRLANDPGSAVTMVTLEFPADALDRVKLAIQIAQSYRLVSRS